MYAKLFSSLFQGSLWGKSDEQHVFMYLLAHADREGWVDIIPAKIASDTGLPLESVRKALKALSEPDPLSRSKKSEGRRIVTIDDHREWGWQIVNYEDYRNIMDEETRREQWRNSKARSRMADREGDPIALKAMEIYDAYPKKVAKPAAMRAICGALRTHPSVDILAATVKYAEAVKDMDPQYIPHPSTWFNQERFNDDPATWVKNDNGHDFRKRKDTRRSSFI